jgi:ABC-type transport system substrate-binding protein
VDAPAIVKNIFDGGGYVLNGPVAANVIGYDPSHKRYPYDPKKSRDLLAKAGYPAAVPVKLYLSSGRVAQDREACQVVAAQMEKGGFKVELISQEWAIFWGPSGVNGGSCLFTTSAEAAWSTPIRFTTNIFAPALRSEWPTAIRSSIS